MFHEPPKSVTLDPAVSQFLSRPAGLWIGGQECPSADGRTVAVVDPATEAEIGQSACASAADVDRAVRAARKTFEDRAWRNLPPATRTKMLWRLAELIEANASALAELETLNEGMPIGICRSLIGHAVPDMLQFVAGWATKIEGTTVRMSLPDERPAGALGPPYHGYSVREPVGVVGAIVPWNVPLLMAVAKVGPALAAGCTVVLKPAMETPFTACWLGRLIKEAGFPDGAVNILPGLGPEAGAALVAHPDVNMISFTGSTRVGRDLAGIAAQGMKRVQLELGGKSPVLIFNDADLGKAVAATSEGIIFNSGQICFAGTRVYAQRAVFDEVAERLKLALQQVSIGHGMDPATQLGPLISARQRERVLGYIASARQEGGEIVCGGNALGERGYFVEPSLILASRQDMTVIREEIFGPVLTLSPIEDIADVPHLANATDYGLSAAIWSRDLKRAHALAAEIQAGAISVNCGTALDDSLPFGGFKHSGWGREGGRHGVEIYTEIKSVVMAL